MTSHLKGKIEVNIGIICHFFSWPSLWHLEWSRVRCPQRTLAARGKKPKSGTAGGRAWGRPQYAYGPRGEPEWHREERSWGKRHRRDRGRPRSFPGGRRFRTQFRGPMCLQSCRQLLRGGWGWLNEESLTVHHAAACGVDEFDCDGDVPFFVYGGGELALEFESEAVLFPSEQFLNGFVVGFPPVVCLLHFFRLFLSPDACFFEHLSWL